MRVEPINVPVAMELATQLATQVVPAAPGWRLLVLGPDGDDELCPVVAWRVEGDSLVPFARLHGQSGYGVSLWAGDRERVVGLLAPGEEFCSGWQEACDQQREALREAQERSEGHRGS